MERLAVLGLHSRTPFPVAPHLIASRTYNVRGILIAFTDMVAEMQFLEQVRICARVGNGERKAALAREFGISRETLYQYLRQNAGRKARGRLNGKGDK